MHTYKKGFRAEHELMDMLSSLGYAVLRAPKSGSDTIDMIACKNTAYGPKLFVFECKFWANTVRIDERQMNSLIDFSQKAGATPIVAIKEANEGWKFLKAEDVRDNKGVASKELLANNSFSVEFFGSY
jgi:Holliday junction resolvase